MRNTPGGSRTSVLEQQQHIKLKPCPQELSRLCCPETPSFSSVSKSRHVGSIRLLHYCASNSYFILNFAMLSLIPITTCVCRCLHTRLATCVIIQSLIHMSFVLRTIFSSFPNAAFATLRTGRAGAHGPPPEMQLSLASLQSPKLGRAPGIVDEPFAWDSREFLRKKCIGKPVCGVFCLLSLSFERVVELELCRTLSYRRRDLR